MKYFILLLLIFSFNLQAHTISFIGPCEKKPLFSKVVPNLSLSVGKLTVEVLESAKINFVGSEKGLSSVFGTPVGPAAMEIISQTEIRAYGWCYLVDGVGPEVYPHELILSPAFARVEWVFGFAHFKDGVWISQCTPAYRVKPKFLCE